MNIPKTMLAALCLTAALVLAGGGPGRAWPGPLWALTLGTLASATVQLTVSAIREPRPARRERTRQDVR